MEEVGSGAPSVASVASVASVPPWLSQSSIPRGRKNRESTIPAATSAAALLRDCGGRDVSLY